MNGIQSFSMHSSFPKREYTINDMESNLRELQLAPTSTLLIIPVSLAYSVKFVFHQWRSYSRTNTLAKKNFTFTLKLRLINFVTQATTLIFTLKNFNSGENSK
jgi:hypothetical protein